jgi:hypothetical protein
MGSRQKTSIRLRLTARIGAGVAIRFYGSVELGPRTRLDIDGSPSDAAGACSSSAGIAVIKNSPRSPYVPLKAITLTGVVDHSRMTPRIEREGNQLPIDRATCPFGGSVIVADSPVESPSGVKTSSSTDTGTP